MMSDEVKDTYRFFAYGYNKDLKHNIKNGLLFDIMFGLSVNSFVLENEERLSRFIEKYWRG